jgi:hypothetical protein
MDSKDTVKAQPTDEAGTISWRRYNNQLQYTKPMAEAQPPASNHAIDNTVPPTIAIRHIIHREVQMAVAHLVAEIDGLTQRCEELEIELGVTYDLV